MVLRGPQGNGSSGRSGAGAHRLLLATQAPGHSSPLSPPFSPSPSSSKVLSLLLTLLPSWGDSSPPATWRCGEPSLGERFLLQRWDVLADNPQKGCGSVCPLISKFQEWESFKSMCWLRESMFQILSNSFTKKLGNLFLGWQLASLRNDLKLFQVQP